MRYCFAAPPGREMVDLDFSGMELRALCSPRIADEKQMADAFNRGEDIHRYTASLMFKVPQNEITDEERRQAKAVNFGAAYGSGPGGLVGYFQSIGQIISWEEGDAFLRAWISSYPAIERWHNDAREVVKGGGDVRMVDGRRCFLMGERSKHTIYCNNQVQGSCASATKLALYGVWKELPALDTSARIVGAIHDEILIECEQGKGEAILAMAREQMREAGEDIFGPEVPLEADGSVGSSWGAAH
jgi:DNA polymerase-1